MQSGGCDSAVADGNVALVEHLECKTQCAHGVVLIVEQLVFNAFTSSAFAHGAAHGEDYFGSALDVQNTSAGHQSRVYHSSHILPLGVEGQLVDYGRIFAQLTVVGAVLVEPQQQCALSRIAEHGGAVGLGEIELCGGVERH